MPNCYWREIKAVDRITQPTPGQSSWDCHQHLPGPISLWLLRLPQTEAQVKRELNTGTESPAHGWCRQKMHIQYSDFNVEYKICNKSCVLQFGVAPLTCRQEGWG